MDVLAVMKQRLDDAEGDVKRLRAAIAVLEQGDSPEPARARRRATEAKPAAKAVPLGKILNAVKAEPGLTTSTLTKKLGGDQSQVLGLLKEAEADGKVVRSGQRRATSWSLKTGQSDEEKIAARAAEIAAQSNAKKAPASRPS